jgi:protein ImuA
MRWVSCHENALRIEDDRSTEGEGEDAPLRWTPQRALVRRAVHELLFEPSGETPAPWGPALWCAREAMGQSKARAVIWLDPEGTVYPPAIVAGGVPWGDLHVLRPTPKNWGWTVAECLRCRGVGAVVARVAGRLSRVEARRLQLAAEEGGGVGVLLRTTGKGSDIYAATTRWRVSPAPGAARAQRWRMELVHGQGRQVGQSYLLERPRAAVADFRIFPNPAPLPLRPPSALADHAPAAPLARTAG